MICRISGIDTKVKMFADDTKLYTNICNENDTDILQQDLVKLSDWSQKWCLSFNADKCKVMHIGPNNPKVQYSMNNKTLATTNSEKDLGVYTSDDMKPSLNCAKAAHKATTALGIIKRTFDYIDVKGFNKIYKGYIRPHLEYCIQAWRPYLRKDIDLLERVQRRATKIIPQLKHLDYKDRLQLLELPTLENRWNRGDLIETFKILKDLDNVDKESFFKLEQSGHNTRGHAIKLHKPRLNKSILQRKHFYSQRVIDPWNQLQQAAIDSPNINTFKWEI